MYVSTYEVCPEGIQPYNMKNRDIYWRYKIQETLYIRQWCHSLLQSSHLGTSQFSQSPSAALFYFPESHRWPEISSLSKVILVLEKARSHRAPSWGLSGGWVTWVIWYFAKKLWMTHYAWAGTSLWWSCQSPVAHSCSLLKHLNGFHGGMFELNTKFDADLYLYSLSHFECTGHTVHMLTKWRLLPLLTSTVKSSLFTHAHSSPLSLAVRVLLMLRKPFSLY